MPARRRRGKSEEKEEGNRVPESADCNNEPIVVTGASVRIIKRPNDGTLDLHATKVAELESSTRIVKKMAMYRFILFGILLHDFVTYLPSQVLSSIGPDDWFTYDQFRFFYELAPKQDNPKAAQLCAFIYGTGIATGVLAMLGGIPKIPNTFQLSGVIFLSLYAFRFFMFVQFFTNHNYLFLLLGILVTITGGGSLSPPKITQKMDAKDKHQLDSLIQKSEWGSICVRLQYAVIYFFASLWKFTPDWLDGTICKGIFLTFEDQGVNRGVPWHQLYDTYGPFLFKIVSLGGIILDTAMFLALAFHKPSQRSVKMFTTLSVMFHGFTCLTMSQRIGYTFPLCCLAGSLIYQPIGCDDVYSATAMSKKDDDYKLKKRDNKLKTKHIVVNASVNEPEEANLIGWVQRYQTGHFKARASPRQRQFTLIWLFIQLALPLRMPIISKGTWPMTSRCYRFSWTMMLHSRGNAILHSGMMPDFNNSEQPFTLPLDMVSLYGECAQNVPVNRNKYFPESMSPFEDPRTIPLRRALQVRHRALLDQFPRYIARVAGGWSDLMYRQAPGACHNTGTGETRHIQVYGNVHIQLNNKGAFCRLFDPTVDLVEADHARKDRGWLDFLRGWILDLAPANYEYMLLQGVGSMNQKAEAMKQKIPTQFPNIYRVEMIADRSSCLAAQSISFFTKNFPLGAMLLEAPEHVKVQVATRISDPNAPLTKQWESLSEPTSTTLEKGTPTMAMGHIVEFSAELDRMSASFPPCDKTTEEDILIALLFMR